MSYEKIEKLFLKIEYDGKNQYLDRDETLPILQEYCKQFRKIEESVNERGEGYWTFEGRDRGIKVMVESHRFTKNISVMITITVEYDKVDFELIDKAKQLYNDLLKRIIEV